MKRVTSKTEKTTKKAAPKTKKVTKVFTPKSGSAAKVKRADKSMAVTLEATGLDELQPIRVMKGRGR